MRYVTKNVLIPVVTNEGSPFWAHLNAAGECGCLIDNLDRDMMVLVAACERMIELLVRSNDEIYSNFRAKREQVALEQFETKRVNEKKVQEVGVEHGRAALLMGSVPMIKLLYDPDELGWAEDLGDGTAKIANVPFGGRLNIDDVVRVVWSSTNGGVPTAGEIVSRAFPFRSEIRYGKPYDKNYAKLLKAFSAQGWKLEGGIPGLAMLAHAEGRSISKVAGDAGVVVTCIVLKLEQV